MRLICFSFMYRIQSSPCRALLWFHSPPHTYGSHSETCILPYQCFAQCLCVFEIFLKCMNKISKFFCWSTSCLISYNSDIKKTIMVMINEFSPPPKKWSQFVSKGFVLDILSVLVLMYIFVATRLFPLGTGPTVCLITVRQWMDSAPPPCSRFAVCLLTFYGFQNYW